MNPGADQQDPLVLALFGLRVDPEPPRPEEFFHGNQAWDNWKKREDRRIAEASRLDRERLNPSEGPTEQELQAALRRRMQRSLSPSDTPTGEP